MRKERGPVWKRWASFYASCVNDLRDNLDALLGYVLLGTFVFLVARAAEAEGRVQRD